MILLPGSADECLYRACCDCHLNRCIAYKTFCTPANKLSIEGANLHMEKWDVLFWYLCSVLFISFYWRRVQSDIFWHLFCFIVRFDDESVGAWECNIILAHRTSLILSCMNYNNLSQDCFSYMFLCLVHYRHEQKLKTKTKNKRTNFQAVFHLSNWWQRLSEEINLYQTNQ